MSASKCTRLIPFAAQWILTKDELKALKNLQHGYLRSSYISIGGVKYCFDIYPNGTRKKNHGKVVVVLGIEMGSSFKKIQAKYTMEIESANFLQDFTHTFSSKEKSQSFNEICETSALFDAAKCFIVDRKMVLKIYGCFEVEEKEDKPLFFGTVGPELWEKDEGKDFKIVIGRKKIMVHKFVLAAVSPVLAERFKKIKVINALIITNFSCNVIEAAMKDIYGCVDTMKADCNDIMSLIHFFDKYDIHYYKDRYIKITFRCHGMPLKDDDQISRSEKRGSYIKQTVILGDKLWESDDYKDFKIIVQGKEIKKLPDDQAKRKYIEPSASFKVHKLILELKSPKFAAMCNSNKGPERNQIIISDFAFNIVETAMKLIYGCRDILYKSFDEEKMSLLYFSEKYKFPSLKKILEEVLIGQLCISNVCLLVNCSIASNASKLQRYCIKFLKTAVAAKIQISDAKILDKYVATNILENPLFTTVHTQMK